PELMLQLAERQVTAFALDMMPRISRAQTMDALTSMSTVAGYKGTLLGASACSKFFPMLMTAAGTVSPAKVLIIGAGVAGLQAIATARRLGSVIGDLAADMGGNCELAVPGDTVVREGVTIIAPLNLPSTMPLHASQMYSKNMSNFLLQLVRDGELHLDFEDEIIGGTCVTRGGQIVNSAVGDLVSSREPVPAGSTQPA